ncbi:DMT family transporter [Propionivibrio dicarboxylicus]|uniref:Permease of the drug/metabolite transporter (DMT) superfamily n=1 Tax=Propionivibrio dicarboxylicus TaxID=83767 RepID=A0A1G8JYT2_9RHOO|nr:DMT family transporter [Propionivibrio dicarboxylicus]SDI36376.1 Permease of the drug/metabolite transporter (DMT) superfamily [Propionivibrio dicarboxylicus]
MPRDVLYALTAAALFGASTPLAKLLVGAMPPMLLAGLLYLGSGVGLALIHVGRRVFSDAGTGPSPLLPREWPWLLGAVLFGGILGPVALMAGLVRTSGATASLLLNLEAVLTAAIAWLAFKENTDRRIVLGMAAIVAGGMILSLTPADASPGAWSGPALIALACLCWAIDNNLTRHISAADPLFIAGTKGLIAGTANCAAALSLGATLPSTPATAMTMVIGLGGYGISLVLFVLALRGLGTARTGAYFSTAPFIGAALSLLLLGERSSAEFWLASALIGIGVYLHLIERHAHEHTHEALEHRHRHRHDEHHQHEHADGDDGQEAHDHLHVHATITHTHPHTPDIHHRHRHD